MPFVNWRAMNNAARRQLAKIGVDIDVTARTSELTFAARQMVELAKAHRIVVVLAAVGLYGVVSHLVAQRTHEMGIRMALGANRGDVFSLVVKQGLRLTFVGTLIGIPCALGAAQLLVHLVPSVRPGDPSTLTAVSTLLLSIAFAASYIPARRATRVDPIVALRYE